MGMAAILFNSEVPFEQTDNTPSPESPMRNLVKIGQAVSEKKTFKDYTLLFMYIAKGQGRKPQGGQHIKFYYFNHTL